MSSIRVNELMVGDFLYSIIDRYDHMEKKLCRVTGIRTDSDIPLIQCDDTDVWYSTESYEPIPLTKEILEKNGFHYGYTTNEEDIAANTIAQLSEEDKGWVWDEGGGAIKVILPNNTDGGMVFIDDQSFDKCMTLCFAKMIFVHQLQHALRLCQIEKEIEL